MEKITVDQAARELRIKPESLRHAMRQDKIPFGSAFKREGSSQYTYIIYPGKFREYVYGLKGEMCG